MEVNTQLEQYQKKCGVCWLCEEDIYMYKFVFKPNVRGLDDEVVIKTMVKMNMYFSGNRKFIRHIIS